MTPKFQFRSISTTTTVDVTYDRPPNESYQIYCEVCGLTTTKVETDMRQWEQALKNKNVLSELNYHYTSARGVVARSRFLFKLAMEDILSLNPSRIYMPGEHWLIQQLNKKFIQIEKPVTFITSYYGNSKSHTESIKELEFPDYIENTHQDLTNLTYSDNTFDYIHSNHMLEHIYDYKQSIKELRRILRKGGTLIITVPVHWQKENNLEWATLTSTGEIKWNYRPAYHGNGNEFPVFWIFGIELISDIKKIFVGSDVVVESYTDYNIGVFNQGFYIIRIKK